MSSANSDQSQSTLSSANSYQSESISALSAWKVIKKDDFLSIN